MKRICLIIGILIFCFFTSCDLGNWEKTVYVKYEVSGTAANADILYLDENETVQSAPATILPWAKEIIFSGVDRDSKIYVSLSGTNHLTGIMTVKIYYKINVDDVYSLYKQTSDASYAAITDVITL